jgi:hypothetical protein
VTIGADIGQRKDPTAVAVVELQWRGGETLNRDDHYVVRHLGRLPLATPYPAIAAEIARIVDGVKARVERVEQRVADGLPWAATIVREERPHLTLYVDATGVGQPVVDLLDAAGTYPIGCYFTYGERRTRQGREVRLGKAWMVSRLQAIAQSGRLHLPKTSEAEATRQELLDYEIRVSDDGADTYGAFKTGRHDDLVTALGLATQPPAGQVYVW